jgi:hypothetical protein
MWNVITGNLVVSALTLKRYSLLTMKFGVLLLPLAFSSCPTTAGMPPTRVTYVLTGMMSGPYRITADLERGIVEEAESPVRPGRDQPRANPLTLPVTKSRALDAQAVDAIRRAESDVFAKGANSESKCPRGYIPTVDAFLTFYITKAGVTSSRSTPGACETEEASALQRILFCSADPSGHGCETLQ